MTSSTSTDRPGVIERVILHRLAPIDAPPTRSAFSGVVRYRAPTDQPTVSIVNTRVCVHVWSLWEVRTRVNPRARSFGVGTLGTRARQ